MTIQADRRGSHEFPTRWSSHAIRSAPVVPPINSGVTPLAGLTAVNQRQRLLKAKRLLTVAQQVSITTTPKMSFDEWLNELRRENIAKNISVSRLP